MQKKENVEKRTTAWGHFCLPVASEQSEQSLTSEPPGVEVRGGGCVIKVCVIQFLSTTADKVLDRKQINRGMRKL